MRDPDSYRSSHREVGGIVGAHEGVLVVQRDDGKRTTAAGGERVYDRGQALVEADVPPSDVEQGQVGLRPRYDGRADLQRPLEGA